MESFNGTLLPSAHDLLLVFPRLAQRAGAFALHYAERFDGFLGMVREPGTVIADPTVPGIANASMNTTRAFVQASTLATAKMATPATTSSAWYRVEYIKQMGGLFNYLFSKWSLVTFAIVPHSIPVDRLVPLTKNRRSF